VSIGMSCTHLVKQAATQCRSGHCARHVRFSEKNGKPGTVDCVRQSGGGDRVLLEGMHGTFNGIPLKNIIALKTKVRSVGGCPTFTTWNFQNFSEGFLEIGRKPRLIHRVLPFARQRFSHRSTRAAISRAQDWLHETDHAF